MYTSIEYFTNHLSSLMVYNGIHKSTHKCSLIFPEIQTKHYHIMLLNQYIKSAYVNKQIDTIHKKKHISGTNSFQHLVLLTPTFINKETGKIQPGIFF